MIGSTEPMHTLSFLYTTIPFERHTDVRVTAGIDRALNDGAHYKRRTQHRGTSKDLAHSARRSQTLSTTARDVRIREGVLGATAVRRGQSVTSATSGGKRRLGSVRDAVSEVATINLIRCKLPYTCG